MALLRSPAELSHRIYPADDVAARVGLVGFADVGQGLWVAEDVDGLLHLGQILGADQDGRRVTVAGQHDPFMGVLDPVDELGQVVADGPQRFDAHGHNCGSGQWRSQRGGRVASLRKSQLTVFSGVMRSQAWRPSWVICSAPKYLAAMRRSGSARSGPVSGSVSRPVRGTGPTAAARPSISTPRSSW